MLLTKVWLHHYIFVAENASTFIHEKKVAIVCRFQEMYAKKLNKNCFTDVDKTRYKIRQIVCDILSVIWTVRTTQTRKNKQEKEKERE